VESARPATEADLARLVELAHAMRVELGEERGGPLWATREARAEPLDAAFDALVGRDDAAVLVGTYDDVVVGFGAAHVEVLRDGSRLGVVDEIYVEPGLPLGVTSELTARGHKVVPTPRATSANSIMVTRDGFVGAPDPRTRGSSAAGY